jgi:hypothetical protein
MTSIILYRENIRKFVDGLTGVQSDLQYTFNGMAEAGQAAAADRTAGSFPAVRSFRRNARKGVGMHCSVLEKTADLSEK